MKLLISIAALLMTTSVSAKELHMPTLFKTILNQPVKTMALNWTVGDKAEYSINMGFIKGTNKTLVREKNERGFWVEQDMDLGFAGKQKAEILFDKNTGQILEFIVNGEPQDLPEPGNQEVIEMREDNITVPAGNFDCVYAKIRDNDKDQTSEAWLNPQLIPVSGMIKQVAPGPMGTITMELLSFEKN